MKSLMAYGGNNILDMTLRKVYEQNPALFKGSGTAIGFSYSFEVKKPPTAVLEISDTAPAHNIKVQLESVALNVTSPVVNFSRKIAMTGLGNISITAGILSFRSLSLSIESNAAIDVAIQQVINNKIIPELERILPGIRLPQLQHIFGSSLSVRLLNGTVIGGPALEIGAKISGTTGIAAADRPSANDLHLLNTGSSANALIAGTVSEDAINAVIKRMIKASDLKYAFTKKQNGALGFAGGVKGNIRSTKPKISINNNRGSVSAVVSADLWAGIKTPLTGWSWIPISVPDVQITLSNNLRTNGNKALLVLTGVSSIRFNLNWPSVLAPVASLVETLLNTAINHFKGMISNVISGIEVELFQLPATIPGTDITGTLSFEGSGGINYYRKSVKATIRIRS